MIASRIPGNVGVLGPDHPGYFAPKDTDALRDALWRAESAPGFLNELARHGAQRAPLFAPEREEEAWRQLLSAVG